MNSKLIGSYSSSGLMLNVTVNYALQMKVNMLYSLALRDISRYSQ